MPGAVRPHLPALLAEMERLMRPADPIAWGRELERTMTLWTPPNWDAIAEFYFEAFADVPGDLAFEALKRARSACTFLPKPAELRALIDDDWAGRIRDRGRLQHMRSKGAAGDDGPGRSWSELTPEEQAKHEEVMAGLRKLSRRAPEAERPRPKPRHVRQSMYATPAGTETPQDDA